MQLALIGAIVARIAAAVLVFDPAGLVSFEVPKIAAGRVAEAVLLALIIIAVFRHGPGVVPRSRLHFAVAGVILAALLSLAFAENRYIGLFGEYRSYLGFTTMAGMALLYVAAATAIRRQRDALLLAAALAVVVTLIVSYALLQRLGLDPFRWADDHRFRPISTMGNANVLDHLLTVAFGASTAVAALGPGVVQARYRAAALALASASIALILLGGARAALVGSVMSLPVLGLLWLRSHPRTARTALFTAATAAMTAVLIAAALVATPAGQRLTATLGGAGLRDRQLIFESALAAVADRPLTGFGPDGFGVAYPRYRQPGSADVLSVISEVSAHSWPLQTAATLGLIGLAALAASIGTFAVLAWRSLDRVPVGISAVATGAAAYWATGLLTVGSVAVEWVPWLAFGAVAGLSSLSGDGRPARHASRWLAASVGMIALIALVMASGPLANNRDLARVSADHAAGNAGPAIALAGTVVRRDPGRAEHWNWLGLAHTKAQAWREAGDAFAEAASRSPHRVTYWANLARARYLQARANDTRSGGIAAALAAARRAVDADPNDAEGHAVLAQVAIGAGDTPLALAEARRAFQVFPSGTGSDAIIAEVAINSSDVPAARALIDDLLKVRPSREFYIAGARLALKVGDREAARRYVDGILALEPEDVIGKQLLRELTAPPP